MRVCTKCKQVLSFDNFSTYQSKSRGERRRSACKNCETNRQLLYNQNNRAKKREGYRKQKEKYLTAGGDVALRFFLNSRMSHYKKTANQLGLPYDIDVDYLIALYHQQNGKCYYLGEKLLYNHGLGKQQFNSMSLDRLTPNAGYVKDNVVFCCWFVNTAKGNLTKQEFYKFCSLVVERSKVV